MVDGITTANVSTLQATLNSLQGQGWTIFLVAPLIRATNPIPCDAACVKASGQGWAWADSLWYDIVAYKGSAANVPAVVVPVPAAPEPAGLPTCMSSTGAPGAGWVKTSAGGWVPPSSSLAASGICKAGS